MHRGEFTPPITNTWTHWKAHIIHNNNVYKFRSSFKYIDECELLSNNSLAEQYKKLKQAYDHNTKN